ncbi:MAG: helix-hairpin-helix domain-containing protein [Gemmatimonadota bacterium]
MRAGDIARILDEIARLLEFRGDNAFKIRAYRGGARTLRGLDEPLEEVLAAGRLRELAGIGPALAEKIEQLAAGRPVPLYERLRAEIPLALLDLADVPGVGPKRARALHEALGVTTLEELEAAASNGRLATVAGFGAKTVDAVVAGIASVRAHAGLILGHEAFGLAEQLRARLTAHPAVTRADVAGEVRRRLEVASEIVLLAASDEPDAVLDAFLTAPSVDALLERAPGQMRVHLAQRITASLVVVQKKAYATALLQATGSADHWAQLGARAHARKLTLDAAGLRRAGARGARVACPDEAACYAALGLAEIPPELREGRGEVDAAAAGPLPPLVTRANLRGVVHCHTTWSDGRASIAEMAAAATARGYEYLVICDHSRTASYAGGLSIDDLKRQRDEIGAVNAVAPGCTVLAGSEVDILRDGALDYPEAVLAELDCVVASAHGPFRLPRAEQTARICRALENPYVDILGHATGRLLLQRDGYALDLDAVLDTAATHGVTIEINADPRRLDLDWRWHQPARARGLQFSIDPDAHSPQGMDYVDGGIGVARKGGLTPADVINTLPLKQFRAGLRRNRVTPTRPGRKRPLRRLKGEA